MKYIGETSRNIKKRLYEHKLDISLDHRNNALFQHISKTNHHFNFYAATMLAYNDNKSWRQIFEAGAISLLSSVNKLPQFFNVSDFLSNLILNSYDISNFD